MDKIKPMRLSFLAVFVLLLSSCGDDFGRPETGNTTYIPVLLSRADLEKSVKASEPRALKKPGKIYFYKNYIFISERYKGVHIIDNSVPESPVNLRFVDVPGCLDMAVKGDVLYADNAVDMVCLDISDVNDIREVKRIKNAFPELVPPDLTALPDEFQSANRPANTVIVEWTN